MPELYAAAWRVTLGSLVLLDSDEYMGAEPRIIPKGQLDTEPLARAAAPFIYGRGNVSNTIKFSRIRIFDTASDAQAFLATHAAEVPICGTPSVLNIETVAGTISFLTAVLVSAGEMRVEANRFLADYEVLCGTVVPDVIGGASDYQAAAISVDGTTTITPTGHTSFLTEWITVSGGSGSYTGVFALDITDRLNGHKIWMRVDMPASAHPAIQIRNATGAGALLATVPADAAKARTYQYFFVFDGTAWTLAASQEAGMGDDAIIWNPSSGPTDGTGSDSISSTGTTTLTPAAGVAYYLETLTVGAGSGAYTGKIVLDITGRLIGERIRVDAAMPANTNPTVELHNATAGGTLLATVPTDAAAVRHYQYLAVFDGTEWVLIASQEELA